MERVKKTFTIEATPDTMKRFERFLCFFHYNGGHSGLFAMSFDGDGHEIMKIDPPPDKDLMDGMRDVAGKDVEIAEEEGFSGQSLQPEEELEEKRMIHAILQRIKS
jgi:hypothetical protein